MQFWSVWFRYIFEKAKPKQCFSQDSFNFKIMFSVTCEDFLVTLTNTLRNTFLEIKKQLEAIQAYFSPLNLHDIICLRTYLERLLVLEETDQNYSVSKLLSACYKNPCKVPVKE